MHGLKGRAILMVLMGAFVAAPASAATIISVAAGGVVIDGFDTSTVGSGAEPWLLNETMTGNALVSFSEVDGSALGENTTGSGHAFGKWLQKTILNNTTDNWTSFELELRVDPELASLDGDGLSFAQGSGFEGTFFADRFALVLGDRGHPRLPEFPRRYRDAGRERHVHVRDDRQRLQEPVLPSSETEYQGGWSDSGTSVAASAGLRSHRCDRAQGPQPPRPQMMSHSGSASL